MQQHPGEFTLKDMCILLSGEVPVLLAGLHVCEHHTVDQLLQAPFPLVGAQCATEVLGGHDGRCVQRPERRELDAALFEHHLVGLPVRLQDVPTFPFDLVVRVNSGRRVQRFDGQARRVHGHLCPFRACGARLGNGLLGHMPSFWTTVARGRLCPSVISMGTSLAPPPDC